MFVFCCFSSDSRTVTWIENEEMSPEPTVASSKWVEFLSLIGHVRVFLHYGFKISSRVTFHSP